MTCAEADKIGQSVYLGEKHEDPNFADDKGVDVDGVDNDWLNFQDRKILKLVPKPSLTFGYVDV